jgi:hypothetical protein
MKKCKVELTPGFLGIRHNLLPFHRPPKLQWWIFFIIMFRSYSIPGTTYIQFPECEHWRHLPAASKCPELGSAKSQCNNFSRWYCGATSESKCLFGYRCCPPKRKNSRALRLAIVLRHVRLSFRIIHCIDSKWSLPISKYKWKVL